MQKYTPYVFPLIVFGVIFVLVFRWYGLRSQRSEYALLGEGVTIENLSQEELVKSIQGVGDYESVALQPENPAENPGVNGVIRYEVADEEVRLSLMANLPETEQEYSVWLKSTDGKAMRQGFVLTPGKGGYIGSAVLPKELFPLEFIVSEAQSAQTVDENQVLKGILEVPQE